MTNTLQPPPPARRRSSKTLNCSLKTSVLYSLRGCTEDTVFGSVLQYHISIDLFLMDALFHLTFHSAGAGGAPAVECERENQSHCVWFE